MKKSEKTTLCSVGFEFQQKSRTWNSDENTHDENTAK